MIRVLSRLLLVFLLATGARAAAPPTFEGILIRQDGTFRKIFVVTATGTSLRYREEKDAAEIKDVRMSDLKSVVLHEPVLLAAAIDLFQGRRYQEAKTAFSNIRKTHEPVMTLPDNPGTIAAFYELECFRKLGDLDGLADALKKFNKDPLVREHQLRQIEIYLFWDSVRTKNWGRISALAKDREKQRLPGYQRAQIAWCHALALEATGKSPEALDAYNTALTADAGASEEIARKAALAILRLHLADPAVKEALKESGSKNSRLAEARAVASLFQLSLGAGDPLPEEYGVFLK